MEDFSLDDDDFGDLYADVEVQAKSAISSALLSAGENDVVEDEVLKHNNNNETGNEANPNNTNSAEKLKKFCGLEEGNESESEDDLNIVLNSDDVDCNHNSIDQEEDEPYKAVKQSGSAFPINRKVNGDYCNKYGRGNWEDNRCKQQQYEISSASQVASNNNVHAAGSSVMASQPHCFNGYGFSLPWYRTIVDVNIDALEEKRWRFLGVDLSDYFNFGFNEDSWKQYCNSLEQLQQHSHMHSRSANQEFSKHTQACESVSEHDRAAKEIVAQDVALAGTSVKSVDVGERLKGLPKGKAIQVEDSTVERQSTMDVRHPRIWDSNVVIQINVQDYNENCSGSNKEEFHHTDNSGHVASTSRDLHVDDRKDVHSSGIAAADESLKSLGKIMSPSTDRCVQKISESNKMLLDPDKHVENRNLDVDGYHDHKMNGQASEGIAEVLETIKMEKEYAKNTCKSDQCLTEAELSVGAQSHFSLTLSCSGSDSEASTDSTYNIAEVSGGPLRRSYSGVVQQESVQTDCESSESSDTMRISRYHSRNRSNLWEGGRHQKRRLNKIAGGRTCPDTDSDASSMSRDQVSIDLHGPVEKLHDFDYHSGEDSSYDRLRDVSNCYGRDRFVDSHLQDLCIKHPRRKYHQSNRDVTKTQDRRNWNEGDFRERGLRLDDRDATNRGWHSGGRGLSPEDIVPFTYRMSRRLVSKCKISREMDIRWRRKGDKILHGKKTNFGSRLPDHRNVDIDGIVLRESGRSIQSTNRKRESLDKKYEDDIPFIGRGNLCGVRIHYAHSPPADLENSWCMEIEDEHWDLDSQLLSSRSPRKSYASNEGKLKNMIPPRSTLFDSRVTERYGRHRRSGDKFRDGHWVSFNDTDNAEDGIIYSDEPFHQRRKYSSQCGVLHQMQGESTWQYQNDEFYVERSSRSYEKYSRHERTRPKYRSANGCMVVDDVQLEWNRYMKAERSIGSLNRHPNMMSREEHEWAARRCSHPIDLIFGNGKSSRRSYNVGTVMSNGISEKMNLKFAKKQRILKHFDGTHTGRATKSGNAKTEGNQTDERGLVRLDNVLVTKQDGRMDIEEGQIVPEELIIKKRSKKKQASEKVSLMQQGVKKVLPGKETNTKYDDQRIMESLAKMERRRERFKDSIALKREPDTSMKPQIDLLVNATETKQERPTRKRRWGGG